MPHEHDNEDNNKNNNPAHEAFTKEINKLLIEILFNNEHDKVQDYSIGNEAIEYLVNLAQQEGLDKVKKLIISHSSLLKT